jgi:hypothetical protein
MPPIRSFDSTKQILLKTDFVIAVTFLALVLSFPAYLLLEALWPAERGGDRLLPRTVVMVARLFDTGMRKTTEFPGFSAAPRV